MQATREDASWAKRAGRLLRLFVAFGAIVVGVFLMVLPGPAILFFFIAGSLVATESLYVARLLDWSEVKLRAFWDWARRRWRRLPAIVKFVWGGVFAGLGAAGLFAAYCVMKR